MSRNRKQNVKNTKKADTFVGFAGGQEVYRSRESRGAVLSAVQRAVEKAEPITDDAVGQVVFEPLLGPSCTVYLVTRKLGITSTETVNDVV